MEYIRIILARNLESLRKARGLNRSQVAEMAGLGVSTYSRYEAAGWISDYESLEKIAAAYGVQSTIFFHDPDLDLSSDPLPRKVSFDEKLSMLDPVAREHLEYIIEGLLTKKG